MTHPTIRIIRDEHVALSAMLRSILLLLAEHRRKGTLARFRCAAGDAVLRGRVSGAAAPPQGIGAAVPQAAGAHPLARELLDRLDHDHDRGERNIRDLEHALLAFEMIGETRREAFETAARAYVDFYLAHMAWKSARSCRSPNAC